MEENRSAYADEINIFKWQCPICSTVNRTIGLRFTNNPEELPCWCCGDYIDVYTRDTL